MKLLSHTLLMLFLFCVCAQPDILWAVGNESIITVPDSNVKTFRTDSRSFWNKEDAARDAESLVIGWVSSGGLHAILTSCVSEAFATTAYTGLGNRVRASSDGLGTATAIDYAAVGANCSNPGSGTARVAICALSGNSSGNYQRAAGSNYFVNAVDTTPAIPTDCAHLFDVTILNGAVSAVLPYARRNPESARGNFTDVAAHATSGDGTTASRGWTGWETRINWKRSREDVHFRAGFYTQTQNVTVGGYGMHITGEGYQNTLLTFTGTGVAWTFANPSTADLFNASWKHIALIANDTTTYKVGIQLVNVSDFTASDFCVGCGTYWRGTNSVGLQIKGHELINVHHATLQADIPLQISDNPYSTIDIDHSHFSDLYLLAYSSTVGSCVLIDSGVNLTNVTFDGAQAWISGQNGLKWSDTTTTQISYNLSISNVRWEQSTTATGHAIDIAHNYVLDGLRIINTYFGSGVQTTNGIRLTKVRSVSLENVYYVDNGIALDLDRSTYPITITNSFFATASTISLDTHILVFSSGHSALGNTLPGSALTIYDVASTGANTAVKTWTPVFVGSTVGGTHTYLTQIGKYYVIGNLVYLIGQLQINVKDAAMTGNLQISGIPFAASNVGGTSSGSIGNVGSITHTAGYTSFAITLAQSQNSMAIGENGSANIQLAVPVANTGAQPTFTFTMVYLKD